MSTIIKTNRVNKKKRSAQSKQIIDGIVKSTSIRVTEDQVRNEAKTKTTNMTVYEPNTNEYDCSKYNRLFDPYNRSQEILNEDKILFMVICGNNHKELYADIINNKQEYIDDLYLSANGCLLVNYVAKKWGYDIYTNGLPAKSELNKDKKGIYFCSGGRGGHLLTTYLQEKGTLNCPVMSNYNTLTPTQQQRDTYKLQKELIDKLPLQSPERTIFKPSDICNNFISDIDALKSKHAKKDKEGKITYDFEGIKADIPSFKDYLAYAKYKDRVTEIAENYPTTRVNQ